MKRQTKKEQTETLLSTLPVKCNFFSLPNTVCKIKIIYSQKKRKVVVIQTEIYK